MSKKKDLEEAPVKDWDLAISAINKKLATTGGKLFRLDSTEAPQIEVIPTGLLNLDIALGVLGIPCGRIIELFGRESSGKSSLALQIAKSAQKKFPERPVLYIDLEHAIYRDWVEDKLGMDVSRFWLLQPSSAEQTLDAVNIATNIGAPSLIVIDSIAAMSPQSEIDGESADQTIGVLARLLGKELRKLTMTFAQNNTTFLCINQIRNKIGPFAGETTPGGNALRFFASQRLRTRKVSDVKENGKITGIQSLVDVVKNKVAPPFRSAQITLEFVSGFSEEISLIQVATEYNVIKRAGAWFSYKSENIGQGEMKTAGFLRDNPAISEEIRESVIETYWKENKAPAIVEEDSDGEELL